MPLSATSLCNGEQQCCFLTHHTLSPEQGKPESIAEFAGGSRGGCANKVGFFPPEKREALPSAWWLQLRQHVREFRSSSAPTAAVIECAASSAAWSFFDGADVNEFVLLAVAPRSLAATSTPPDELLIMSISRGTEKKTKSRRFSPTNVASTRCVTVHAR